MVRRLVEHGRTFHGGLQSKQYHRSEPSTCSQNRTPKSDEHGRIEALQVNLTWLAGLTSAATVGIIGGAPWYHTVGLCMVLPFTSACNVVSRWSRG